MHIEYNGCKIPYIVKTDKKLKNLYITITPEGVVVKNPNYSSKKIEKIINEKASWIYKKLQLQNKRYYISKIYQEEKKVLFFGEKQSIDLNIALKDFYKNETSKLIPPLVEKWAKKMNLKPTSIKFRKAKRRWGSCNHKNELSFNTSLTQLPLRCIEYIIVHELSHILHKHHKHSFWLHVEKFFPDYKECEKTLKLYSPEI